MIEFTRTPFVAHSRARNIVRLSTAALLAEYATTRDSGMRALALAILMIEPRPRWHIAGPNSWLGSSTPPTTFMSKFACQSSMVIASMGRSGVTVTFGSLPPAAFTRIAGAPSTAATASCASCRLALSIASAAKNSAVPPAARIAFTRA